MKQKEWIVGNFSFRAIRCGLLLVVCMFTGVGAVAAQSAPTVPIKEIRIGYQKYGTLIILKARGTLDRRLAERGIAVKWTEFPFGPPLLEAINVGSLDVGTTGEAPPIFAQAAGADIVYIGNEPASPAAEALIVPEGSPLKSVAELRGKKIAVAKGSNANYLLVKVLEQGGLRYSDVDVVYLPPADARAAFESGRIDAWSVWDPFYSAAQRQLGARVLADGTGAVSNHQFYLASRSFTQAHPDVVRILLEEIDKIDQWGRKNPAEVASFLSPQIGIELPVLEVAAGRFGYGVQPVSEKVLEAQQKIADAFFALRLIPRAIRVSDAQWKPAQRE